MNVSYFKKLIKPVTDFVSSSKIDAELGEELNRRFPPGAETFDAIEKACHAAVEAGWMCANGEEGGPRWGRVIEPGPETGGFAGGDPAPGDLRIGRDRAHGRPAEPLREFRRDPRGLAGRPAADRGRSVRGHLDPDPPGAVAGRDREGRQDREGMKVTPSPFPPADPQKCG